MIAGNVADTQSLFQSYSGYPHILHRWTVRIGLFARCTTNGENKPGNYHQSEAVSKLSDYLEK